ncbi:p53-like transcription factor [Coniochaeta sp. PMI_546]|nr:p53-like transcription factor [Coniochaeta sp. PMI_546]
MAHAHRSATLPQPGTHLTRDFYPAATPTFRRGPEHHTQREPSFPGNLRRNPLSPTPSPNVAFAPLRMDPGYGQKQQANLPPLNQQTNLGVLTTLDGTQIKYEINGSIDKGFFLADNEWTCYRRNYFSCICSFSLNPDFHGQPMQFTAGTQTFQVHGFAMCISAVVAESDTHSIDLVQHTPKRDKGPIAKPDKVRLSPKPAQAPGYNQMGLYGQPDTGLPSSRPYEQGFGQAQAQLPTEHTFERIQFKQATANNGKRRAAQQYYHLIIELYADVSDVGQQPHWVKMGYRKSAKMIVRGRSPGHYQSERRGSSGSGPSTGSGLGDGGYSGNMMNQHFGGGPTLMTNAYGNSYGDPRHGGYSGGRHHQHHQDVPMEPMLSAEEEKSINETKDYQYFPTTIYETEQDSRNPVEVFHHHHQKTEHESAAHQPTSHRITLATDKVKPEYDSGISNVWYAGSTYCAQRCGRFEGKPASTGYYPSILPPTSSMSMT